MIDIEELKKLPNRDKVELIDQLLHSINNNEEDEPEADDTDADPEIVREMVSRLENMKSGKDPGLTWEQAETHWLQNIESRNAARS